MNNDVPSTSKASDLENKGRSGKSMAVHSLKRKRPEARVNVEFGQSRCSKKLETQEI